MSAIAGTLRAPSRHSATAHKARSLMGKREKIMDKQNFTVTARSTGRRIFVLS